ncbi:MAG: tetratricopeptide repeat protein [Bacteroidales bacterium]|nr:tetratricopeptide repeat protein [Bacteroidales bacterium]
MINISKNISFLKYKFFIILLIIIGFSKLSFSENVDSLINLLNIADTPEKIELYAKISNYYSEKNLKLARTYANKGLKLSKKNNISEKSSSFYIIISSTFETENKIDTALLYLDSAYYEIRKTNSPKIEGRICFMKGRLHYFTENYELAESLFNKALNIYIKLDDTVSIIGSYERLGMTYYMKSNYAKAIDYFLIELKLAESMNYAEAQASSKNNIAMTYATDGDFYNSLLYYNQARKIYQNLNNHKGLATVYNNIGNIYTNLENLDSALYYFKKSSKLSYDLNDEIMYAVAQTNIAEIFIKQNNLIEASDLLNQAKEIFEQYQLITYLSATYHLFGKLYISIKDITKAKDSFYKSIEFAKKTGYKELEKENYLALSDLFFAEKDYNKAYSFHIKYTSLKDSLYNIENSLKINQLKLNYETEKKDKKLQLNQLEIQRQKKLLLFFEIAFSVFVLLVTIAAVFYRKLNKSYKMLVEKNIQIVEKKHKNDIKEEFEIKKEIIDKNYEKQAEDIGLKPEQLEILKTGVEKLIQEKIFLDPDITLDKMSKILNTNKLYLSKFINYEYNKNFNTYINDFRIDEAQKLLISPKHKNLTLDAIADLVGFKSRSSFYSVFKKNTGVTPAFFKKEMESFR